MTHHPVTVFTAGAVDVRTVPARFGLVAFAVFVNGHRTGRAFWHPRAAMAAARQAAR